MPAADVNEMPVSGDIVRVTNRSDVPMAKAFNGKSYVLHPDKETAVPFDAICLWFGDPRSDDLIRNRMNDRGIVTYIPDRASEVRRLRLYWGLPFGDETSFEGGWTPTVDVFTLEGAPLPIVLNDPSGTSITPVTQTAGERDELTNMVLKLQRELAAMQQMMAGQETNPVQEAITDGIEPYIDNSRDIPEDDSSSHYPSGPAAASEPKRRVV